MRFYIAEDPREASGEEPYFPLKHGTRLTEGNYEARVHDSTWHVEQVHDQGEWANVRRRHKPHARYPDPAYEARNENT